MAESFGTLLRNFRLAAGFSLGELADRINYSKPYISKIENGQKRPTAMFAKQCDRVLDTDGALAAAVPPKPTAAAEDVPVLEFEGAGALRFAEMPRRQLLAGAGALLGFAMSRGTHPVIDEQTFAVLRASFDQARALGTMASPGFVLAQVIAHVHTLRTLAVENPEPMRSELLVFAARVAEYAGWMSQEAGWDTDALHWTDQAVALASERDPHMESFAFFRRAEIALYQYNSRQTVDLARRAQEDRTAGPRILGLAARCEAQGHALAGDVRGCEEALDRAANLLAIHDEGIGPVLGSASVPDEVALARGWTLYDLGRPGAAAALLDQQVHTIPTSRARARFGARRALAHAQHGDIDQACVAAREILTDVARVDSATIRLDLRELSRTLGRWHTHRDASDLRHELVTLSHQPA